MTKQERLEAANEFIQIIANCGRKFFRHKDFVSTLELSPAGRVFFIDYYTKKRIYTHTRCGRWDGFTSGGTLRSLIEVMRDFVTKGSLLRLGYFETGGNHWGYGEEILKVRDAARRLGIAT